MTTIPPGPAEADPDTSFVLDTSVPHISRIYDYWLGGKDNFAVDRAAGEQAAKVFPALPASARSNRAFLSRAVRYLAADAGIRQFLDLGTGIPTAGNTHEVAQGVAPEARVVYVDNDPIVLAHARALLTSSPEGATSYIDADLRDTRKIIDEAARTLDFGEPVAVMLVAILHCIPDEDAPGEIVTRLMSAVSPGSYLVISHPPSDQLSGMSAEVASRLNQMMPEKVTFRSQSQVEQFFAGLDLVDPGVVQAYQWRPDPGSAQFLPADNWSGVARKLGPAAA
jgi:S-adenosyl methyltransferase